MGSIVAILALVGVVSLLLSIHLFMISQPYTAIRRNSKILVRASFVYLVLVSAAGSGIYSWRYAHGCSEFSNNTVKTNSRFQVSEMVFGRTWTGQDWSNNQMNFQIVDYNGSSFSATVNNDRGTG